MRLRRAGLSMDCVGVSSLGVCIPRSTIVTSKVQILGSVDAGI
jgi:hypothetical protein